MNDGSEARPGTEAAVGNEDGTMVDGNAQEMGIMLGSGGDSMPDANMGDVYSGQQEHGRRMTSSDMPRNETDAVRDVHGARGGIPDDSAAYIEGEISDDSSSLFVPERPCSTARTGMRPTFPLARPAPPGETRSKQNTNTSMVQRIRNMQKANAEKRNALKKQATVNTYMPEPDNETYLEAIMSNITPSASTPVPAVDDDEMEDRKARAEFQRLQRQYNEFKRVNGKLTFRQNIEWLKIENAEAGRKKKRERDLAKDKEDADADGDVGLEMFPEAYTMWEGDGDEEEEDVFGFGAEGSRKRSREDGLRKEPTCVSMQEAELRSMQVALEACNDMPKKKRKMDDLQDVSQDMWAGAKEKGSKGSKTAKKTASKRPAKSARKTAKSKKTVEHALKQTASLFTSDIFAQQAGNDAREQPAFTSKNKQNALKELIASVPLDEKKQVRSDMTLLIAATKEFDGKASVRSTGDGNWLVKGMCTSLKGYQLLGAAFMRRRENSIQQPRGGLLADHMGLGKTLQTLANIVNGQPPRGQQPKTTLIVAAPALLSQWQKEIAQHTTCNLRVIRYGSGNRVESNSTFDILKSHDIILTTWDEVRMSYPKNDPPIECVTAEQKMAWWKNHYMTQRGVLHRMLFLRIVLDEAQAIKNHASHTSIACRALMGNHKWALSGTPILNGLTELYAYFRFLDVPHTGSFSLFKHNYCDPKDVENTERLLVRLSTFMLRRTHADMMFNAPILKLPQADQGTYWCDFNPVERCIYDIVQQRFVANIHGWQAKGELEKRYHNAMVMLLRLRQLTAHILMLQYVMRDLLEVEDIERIKEVVDEAPVDNATRKGRTIIALRKQLEEHAIEQKKKSAATLKAKAAAQAAGIDYVEAQDITDEMDLQETEDEREEMDSQANGPSGQPSAQEDASLGDSGEKFGKTFNFKPYLKSLKTGLSWENAKKKAKCSYCGGAPRDPWITSCGHLICNVPCMEQSNLAAAELGQHHSPCKTCGKTPVSLQPCEFEEGSPETIAGATRSKTKNRKKQGGEQPDREDISEEWLSLAGADVLPSAKTIAIKAQILNWRKENPEVKIIIYTQFLPMVRILGKICQQEGWQAEQYVGTMSFTARDKAICNFAGNGKCNILLASLRCGGLGLNLTMASRVIMVDPWWNWASEQQAFCRVFRIGQKVETYMSRLCVKNTVDERLMQMQERKQKEISEVMEDGGKRFQKIGMRDLMRLFGNLDEGAEGKPFIMADNPTPHGFRVDTDDEEYGDGD